MEEWIGRAAALEILGVKPQTLYAYVSRRRIRVRPDPVDSRKSLYSAIDIEDLRVRRARGKGRSAVASSTMSWGEPSLGTTVSTVHQGQLIYRGHDAAKMARSATWETAAELLWQSHRPIALSAENQNLRSEPFAALAALVPESYPSLGRNEEKLLADGEAAIASMACAFGAAPCHGPLHERIVNGWGLDESFRDAIRRALVLLADHELNASTFAVRVAASTGAPIAACLLAGLSALSGPRHGGAGAAAVALLDDAGRHGARRAVKRNLAALRYLPGFGHPLYPTGDPRAVALLEALPTDPLADELSAEASDACGIKPNIDFALAVFTRSAKMADDTPFRLFALGRSIGWVAHAIEQAGQGNLIRPRAHYSGTLPTQG